LFCTELKITILNVIDYTPGNLSFKVQCWPQFGADDPGKHVVFVFATAPREEHGIAGIAVAKRNNPA